MTEGVSLLSRPIAFFYLGMVAISAAVEAPPPAAPAAPPHVAPGPPRAPVYTKEELALEPVEVLFRNCKIVTELELGRLQRSTLEPGQETPYPELAKVRKESHEKLEAAWRENARVKESVRVMTLEEETEVFAIPVYRMYVATKELSELTQKMIKILDASTSPDNKALQALVEKAKPFVKAREDNERQVIEDMMRVRGNIEGAKEAAAKAGLLPQEKPGQITPGKKEPELPPGMTRGVK